MRILIFFYNIVLIPLALLFFSIASQFNPKIRKGLQGRKKLFQNLKNEIPTIEAHRQTIWFHVSSYGEFLQAKPVLDQLKSINPNLFLLVTVFSPSGFENIKIQHPVDYLCYLPFDTYFAIKKFFSIINPEIAVIVRHDIWPNFVWRLYTQKIPLYLIDASLPEKSSRFYPVFKSLNKIIFQKISEVFVIAEEEVNKFKMLGVNPDSIKITGDTKYDQVYERSLNTQKISQLINHPDLKEKRIIIAGSTWQEDEAFVIPAFHQVLKNVNNCFLIIAPHEPTLKRINEIEQLCDKFGINSVRLSGFEKYKKETQCLIIDQIGLLSSIYSLGDAAFVGGSFYFKIHNVLEPAVFGMPVFFGPKMTNSAEAIKLINNESAIIVNSVEQIANLLTRVFNDFEFAKKYGDKAKSLVMQNVGSSKKIAEFLVDRLKNGKSM